MIWYEIISQDVFIAKFVPIERCFYAQKDQ